MRSEPHGTQYRMQPHAKHSKTHRLGKAVKQSTLKGKCEESGRPCEPKHTHPSFGKPDGAVIVARGTGTLTFIDDFSAVRSSSVNVEAYRRICVFLDPTSFTGPLFIIKCKEVQYPCLAESHS